MTLLISLFSVVNPATMIAIAAASGLGSYELYRRSLAFEEIPAPIWIGEVVLAWIMIATAVATAIYFFIVTAS